MYNKRNNRRKGYSRKPRNQDYMDNIQYGANGHQTGEGNVDNLIATKSLSKLPKSSYSVQADPYDAALPVSAPYPMLAKFNKAVGGSYAGDDNIDGGNVQQYANSTRSKFLAFFDFMKMKISLNYRYMPSRLAQLPTTEGPDGPYVGSGLVDQARQSIAEATSVLQATTFTQMAIYNYAVETDIPMGTARRTAKKYKGKDGVEHTVYLYTDLSDVIYATTRYYQTFLQDVINTLNWHNSFRLKMGTCIRSSWNRETPSLNSLFSLFKKKSWTALVDSVMLALPGEYVDVEWAKQANALALMPSRRSNSITDPVLELQTRLIHPGVFKMWILDSTGEITGNGPFYDDAIDMVKTILTGGTPATQQISVWDALDDINNHLSAEYAMAWARSSDENKLTVETDNAYFNYVKYRLDVLSLCMTTFKTKFNDVREVLDVVSRTGLVTWSKGFRPSITRDTDAALFDNKIVDDVYQMVFSGANNVHIDTHTKRWRTYTLWNMYSGIPEYDSKSGGAFLTFSGKNIDTADDVDYVFKYVPQMFMADETILTSSDTGVVVNTVARDGATAYIKAKVVNGATNVSLARLFPLDSMSNYTIKIPVLYGELDNEHRSTMIKTLTQVFGMGQINGEDTVYIEPDLLAIYDIEINDITNDCIAYARSNAPFKGATQYEGNLGFDTFGRV